MTYDDDGIVRVLVIDDAEDLRLMIAQLLLNEGCQVVPVATAEEGLEQLPYGRFDVAFVDHNLPGMEGLVFGEYLRQNNPDMQIALVTGSPEENLERAARDRNITFIAKPFEPDDLLSIVDRAKQNVLDRQRASTDRSSDTWAPDLASHLDHIQSFFHMPNVPHRVVDRISHHTRDALAELRHGPIDESTRAAALAGLLAARVLGVHLQHWSDGSSMEEVYDAIMSDSGRRREFSPEPEDSE